MLFYTTVCSILIVSTSYPVVTGVLETSSVEYMMAYYIITSYILAATLSIVILGFFGFHLYLTANQNTTIEFCEKRSDD